MSDIPAPTIAAIIICAMTLPLPGSRYRNTESSIIIISAILIINIMYLEFYVMTKSYEGMKKLRTNQITILEESLSKLMLNFYLNSC